MEYNLIFELRKLRREKDITQEQLADMTGLTQPMIARVERGTVSPSLTTVNKICKALNVRLILASPPE